MPITSLLPASTVTQDGWGFNGGSFPGSINDGSDATWVYCDGFTREYEVSFNDLPGSAAVITSLTSIYRIIATAGWGGNIRQYIELSSVQTVGVDRSPTTGVVQHSEALARPGGGSYTPAEINSCTGGCRGSAGVGGAEHGDVTYQSWSVDWIPASGGFAFLVGSLAGAALGLAEMGALACAVHRRTRSLITTAEYVEAWRDIRDYRHPKFFEMRVA